MIRIKSKGSFRNSERFLDFMKKGDIFKNLERYAQKGVDALAADTPKDSGLAASSWGYEVVKGRGTYSIIWTNVNVENGFRVAVMLQYGYATGTGGWVSGYDYINPALRPIFDEIADAVWKEVTSA